MSERPRDALGRPLPFGSADAVAGPDLTGITSATVAWQRGREYIAAGRPFHAHEVFEERWRTCPDDERFAWQALAQWAAALTHQARGNGTGAASVAHGALDHLNSAPRIPSEIDESGVRASLSALLNT